MYQHVEFHLASDGIDPQLVALFIIYERLNLYIHIRFTIIF